MNLDFLPKNIPRPTVLLMPHIIWILNRYHWNETQNDEEISQYWAPYTDLDNFKTIVGADHAWCMMSGSAALEENGFKSPMSAGARHANGFGRKCILQTNCGVAVKHSTGALAGHWHFMFCFSVDPDGKHFWGIGGNQNNEFNITRFPVEDAVWCFMPETRPTNPDEVEGNPV